MNTPSIWNGKNNWSLVLLFSMWLAFGMLPLHGQYFPPPPPPPPAPLAPPGNLVALGGDHQVTLNWTAPANVWAYGLSCATNANGPFIFFDDAYGYTTSYVHTGLENGTTYYYQIWAEYTNGISFIPASASATPHAPPPPPPPPPLAPPSNLVATGGDQQVTLSWNAPAGATWIGVERATDVNGPYAWIWEGEENTCVDTGLLNGTTYCYRVWAWRPPNELSFMPASASATPMAPPPPPPPAPPTGLTATPGDSQITLNWNASTGATFYFVYRATSSSGPFAIIAELSGTSMVNSGLLNGTTYFYRVVAHNNNGDSAPASASATAAPFSV